MRLCALPGPASRHLMMTVPVRFAMAGIAHFSSTGGGQLINRRSL